MIVWPVAIVFSTLLALWHTVRISCALALSFIAPLVTIGFAIYVGNVFILVMSIVLTLALGAFWAYIGQRDQLEAVSGEDEDDDERSCRQVDLPHLFRVAPVFLSVTFLLLCAWTYGMTPLKMPVVDFRP